MGRSTVDAWPFLIGRGVRVGNRLILSPAPMSDSDRQRLLDLARPPESDSASVLAFGPFTVAVADRRLTVADLRSRTEIAGEPVDEAALVRDEHGRPIRVLYGFAVRGRLASVDRQDLAEAWQRAVAAYRLFHTHEERHRMARSDRFPARSLVESHPVPVPDNDGVPAAASSSGGPAPGQDPAPVGRELIGVGAAAVALLVVVGVLGMQLVGSRSGLELVSEDESCQPTLVGASCNYELRSRRDSPVELHADVHPEPAATDYRIEGFDACNPLAANGSCTFSVTRHSSRTGIDPARLVVTGSEPDDTAVVEFTRD